MEYDPKRRKNSPRNTQHPRLWGDKVWQAFQQKLESNTNSKGKPYYITEPLGHDSPPHLENENCWNPAGCNFITVCVDGQEYQRPLHRILLLLRLREKGEPLPEKEGQASHLCHDSINKDGKGAKHCCNPDHMTVESDAQNKSRQRCAGWIFIHTYGGHAGGYWYPSCTHSPVCIRYTNKAPTLIREATN